MAVKVSSLLLATLVVIGPGVLPSQGQSLRDSHQNNRSQQSAGKKLCDLIASHAQYLESENARDNRYRDSYFVNRGEISDPLVKIGDVYFVERTGQLAFGEKQFYGSRSEKYGPFPKCEFRGSTKRMLQLKITLEGVSLNPYIAGWGAGLVLPSGNKAARVLCSNSSNSENGVTFKQTEFYEENNKLVDYVRPMIADCVNFQVRPVSSPVKSVYQLDPHRRTSRSSSNSSGGLNSDGKFCEIFDPNDEYANVRKSPAGELIGPLKNRMRVLPTGAKQDSQGRYWVYLSYGKNGANWSRDKRGFVLGSLVRCNWDYPNTVRF